MGFVDKLAKEIDADPADVMNVAMNSLFGEETVQSIATVQAALNRLGDGSFIEAVMKNLELAKRIKENTSNALKKISDGRDEIRHGQTMGDLGRKNHEEASEPLMELHRRLELAMDTVSRMKENPRYLLKDIDGFDDLSVLVHDAISVLSDLGMDFHKTSMEKFIERIESGKLTIKNCQKQLQTQLDNLETALKRLSELEQESNGLEAECHVIDKENESEETGFAQRIVLHRRSEAVVVKVDTWHKSVKTWVKAIKNLVDPVITNSVADIESTIVGIEGDIRTYKKKPAALHTYVRQLDSFLTNAKQMVNRNRFRNVEELKKHLEKSSRLMGSYESSYLKILSNIQGIFGGEDISLFQQKYEQALQEIIQFAESAWAASERSGNYIGGTRLIISPEYRGLESSGEAPIYSDELDDLCALVPFLVLQNPPPNANLSLVVIPGRDGYDGHMTIKDSRLGAVTSISLDCNITNLRSGGDYKSVLLTFIWESGAVFPDYALEISSINKKSLDDFLKSVQWDIWFESLFGHNIRFPTHINNAFDRLKGSGWGFVTRHLS